MKNKKALIAILTAIVLIFSFAACANQNAKTEKVTQLVTNENGEPVTDENGEFLTEEFEAQIVTDSNGKAVTEVVTDEKGKVLTTIIDKKPVTVTQVVTVAPSKAANSSKSSTSKKSDSGTNSGKGNSSTTTKTTTKKSTEKPPKAPANVSSLKASNVTQTSVKLTFSSVNCTAYQIQVSADGGKHWEYLEKAYTKTSYTAKDLVSYTDYTFRVRAYNKNKSGTTASKWKEVSVKTKVNKTPRKIKITVNFPINIVVEDKLIIEVDGEEVNSADIKLDGSSYTFTTKDEYKGVVEIKAYLKDKKSEASIKTDKASCSLDIPMDGIPVIGEDED